MQTILFRHRLRAISTTLFLITFPVFFYYLSPVIPINGSISGIITGSLIVFISLFLVSIFSGRWFCSYVCPAGTIQDLLVKARTKTFPRKYFSWIKFIIWAVWLGVLFFFFRRAGGVQAFRFGYFTKNYISVTDVNSMIAYLMVLFVFMLMPLFFGRRAACHTLCWMAPFMIIGKKLGRAVKVPSLRIKSDTEACIDCGRCNSVCPMSLDVQQLQKVGEIKSTDCILCGACIDSCPKKVLSFSWY